MEFDKQDGERGIEDRLSGEVRDIHSNDPSYCGIARHRMGSSFAQCYSVDHIYDTPIP